MYAPCSSCFFLFNDTATTEIYTLSLHDALPISRTAAYGHFGREPQEDGGFSWERDRKSTRLNSSHTVTSYAVFCLKNKKESGGDLHEHHFIGGRGVPSGARGAWMESRDRPGDSK